MDPAADGMSRQDEGTSETSEHPLTRYMSRRKSEHASINKYDNCTTGWRSIVLTFTPSWFSVLTGTGVVPILLHNLPYNTEWIQWIAVVLFAMNVGLFVLFTLMSLVRYIMFPEVWGAMIRHPTHSLFLGVFPQALATIVNMIVFVCVADWGPWAVYLAWALWWICAAISVSTCFFLPFVIMNLHRAELATMTAVWLLPIVACIVAAATGGFVAEVLPDSDHALITLVVGYVLWGAGVPLSLMILVIYFHRLAIYKLPPPEAIVSVFLPLGPFGQGGLAIMQLGKVSLKVFPETGALLPATGAILYTLGFFIGLVLWGFGLVWLFFAIASISSQTRFPFNMGWWGFLYPCGGYATATLLLGEMLGSKFFEYLGMAFSLAVCLLWVVVATRTLTRIYKGEIFVAPCQGEMKQNIVPPEMVEV